MPGAGFQFVSRFIYVVPLLFQSEQVALFAQQSKRESLVFSILVIDRPTCQPLISSPFRDYPPSPCPSPQPLPYSPVCAAPPSCPWCSAPCPQCSAPLVADKRPCGGGSSSGSNRGPAAPDSLRPSPSSSSSGSNRRPAAPGKALIVAQQLLVRL